VRPSGPVAHYNEAAVLQMLIDVLPSHVVQTMNMLKNSTGLDLQALIKHSIDKSTNGSGSGSSGETVTPAV
jgi:hypothetical protein